MLAVLMSWTMIDVQAETLSRDELMEARRILVQEQMREMKEKLDAATAKAIADNAVAVELRRLRRMTSPPVIKQQPKPIRTNTYRVDLSVAPDGIGTHLRTVFKDRPDILARFSEVQLSRTNPPSMTEHAVVK